MPASPALLAVLAFLAAGGLSAVAARGLVAVVEDRSVEAVRAALAQEGHDWAAVEGDGLQVVLEGEAPSEAERFRAISTAGGAVDASRVIDDLHVTPTKALAPPDFAIEILRNDAGVSLVGLIPAATDRDRLAALIADAADGQPVTDLLQVADYPVPDAWPASLDFALDALEGLPRTKISVEAGRVAIDAISDSLQERSRLQDKLTAERPDGVRLALSVSAPRPVIAPFTLRARLSDEGEGRSLVFDACAADTEAALDLITDAARAAGATGPIDCRLGLGSPSPDWGQAAAAGLRALGEVGAGTLTLSDADVSLVAGPAVAPDLLDRVAGDLDRALPDVFALRAERAAAAAPAVGPPEFAATLTEDGVRLRGRMADPRMTATARTFAQARFGSDKVTVATRVAPDGLPNGWSVRVLAGLDALSHLAHGEVRVTPDLIAVSGETGEVAARDEITAGAIAALGPGAALAIDVAYDEALDPLAGLPTPEECLAKITGVTDEAKIAFDPGSATLSAAGRDVVEEVAGILRSCGDLRLRIAGYTDSQGRESSNLALSQARAEAVLAALRDERVPVMGFDAVGYGEASPIADNDTEAGREANRRIEFSLIGPPEVQGPPPPPDHPLAVAQEAAAQAAVQAVADGEAAPRPEPAEQPADQPMAEAPERPEGRPADREQGDGDAAE